MAGANATPTEEPTQEISVEAATFPHELSTPVSLAEAGAITIHSRRGAQSQRIARSPSAIEAGGFGLPIPVSGIGPDRKWPESAGSAHNDDCIAKTLPAFGYDTNGGGTDGTNYSRFRDEMNSIGHSGPLGQRA